MLPNPLENGPVLFREHIRVNARYHFTCKLYFNVVFIMVFRFRHGTVLSFLFSMSLCYVSSML